MGEQHCAYSTELPSLPSKLNTPWLTVSSLACVKRAVLISSMSGRRPCSIRRLVSFFAIMLAMRLPKPISLSSSVLVLLPAKRSSLAHTSSSVFSLGICAKPSARKLCRSSFSPKARDWSSAICFRKFLIFERARPVFTKVSQAGLGLDILAVSISTTSPFCISERSGAGSPLMVAETAC